MWWQYFSLIIGSVFVLMVGGFIWLLARILK